MNPLIAARIGATFFVLFLVFSLLAWWSRRGAVPSPQGDPNESLPQ